LQENKKTNLKSSAYFDWDTQITKAVGNYPRDPRVGDANNDGQNDIVTANDMDNTVSILCWNHTTGDWDAQITKTGVSRPLSVFIGDANNDGQNDIVVTNNHDNDISILCWNTETGDWDDQIKINLVYNPMNVFIEDVNNDGQNDIVVSMASYVEILLWTFSSIPSPPPSNGDGGGGGKKKAEEAIPGYNIPLIFGVIAIISVIVAEIRRKKIK